MNKFKVRVFKVKVYCCSKNMKSCRVVRVHECVYVCACVVCQRHMKCINIMSESEVVLSYS